MISEEHSDQSIPPGRSRLENLALLSDEAFWEYARELARQIATVEYPQEYLECVLQRGNRFIPLHTLYEVVSPPHSIALLPASPVWMPGIVAWRGESIAVIDLESYLTGDPVALGTEATLLIAHYEGLPVGLLVSAISETRHNIPLDEPSPATKEQEKALLVDIPSLLAEALRHIGTATSYG